LFDAFLNLVGDVAAVEMVLREQVVGRVGFLPSDVPEPLGLRLRGSISVTGPDASVAVWNVLDDGKPHDLRTADYEDQALVGVSFADHRVSQAHAPPGTSAIQRIVAMNKALLDGLYPSNRWLFVRLRLLLIPESSVSVSISHEPLVQARVKRSRIEAAGEHAGDIHFWSR